jgi:hypothetical protein
MPLPEFIQVKLSSEAAESISITRVIVQQMPLRQLVEQMLALTGKDLARIRDLLLRGTLVSGASRYRWSGWDADEAALAEMLAGFPDPDPGRPFSADRCVRAVLRSGRHTIDMPRQVGARKPLLGRSSFWDLLMDVAQDAGSSYAGYSYRERADCYRVEFPVTAAERLRAGAGALRYTTLRDQIRTAGVLSAEFYVERA